MRVESREALQRMVKWAAENKYPMLKEFLDNLGVSDVKLLLSVFQKGYPISSTDFAPVVEPPEVTGQATVLRFPFKETFFVIQGNKGAISHFKDSNDEYAWDFVLMLDGVMCKGATHKNENYHAWGLPVYAPAAGKVIATMNEQPDHMPLTTKMKGANYVLIEHENGEISLIYHLRQGSVLVKTGDRVQRGQVIGAIGDSGISMFPHIHYSLDLKNGDKRKPFPGKFATYYAKTAAETDWRLMISSTPKQSEYVMSVDDYLNKFCSIPKSGN